MLTGIEEVDWASLGHAYGPADDVPELLRGLASADPAERETALDGMYGAVHHQGDVYDSTLACIPFLLELVADPAVQDRGCIVELLTSIGGIELDDDDEELDELGSDDEEFIPAANYAMAAAAIAAGADVFLGLVSDPDPEVRLAAPCALASLHPEPARVLTLLRERLTVERDTEVRLALVAAVGRIALRHASLRTETVDWLDWLARAAHDPGLRLAALAQRARCAPGDIPDDVVPWVTGLLEEIRTAANRPAAPGTARAATPTLIGQVRELLEEHAAGRPAPWTEELLRTLHAALDDRVDDRIALILAQLRSPDWGQRADAIWLCGSLIRVWRGRYEEVVRLVGAQLQDPEPRLREAATSFLERLFELGAPAADALAARLAAGPGPAASGTGPGPASGATSGPFSGASPDTTSGATPDTTSGPTSGPTSGSTSGPTPGPASSAGPAFVGRSGRDGALLALARAGDTRAVPLLARALEEPEVRRELLYAMDGLGPSAAMLAPLLRRRLAEVELDERLYDRAAPLLYALAAVRGGQALPEVLRVLRGGPRTGATGCGRPPCGPWRPSGPPPGRPYRTSEDSWPPSPPRSPRRRRGPCGPPRGTGGTCCRPWSGGCGRARRPRTGAPPRRHSARSARRRPRRPRPSGPVWPRGTCGCGSAAPRRCGGCPARRRRPFRCCSRPGRRTGTRAWTSRSAWRRWVRRPRRRSWSSSPS